MVVPFTPETMEDFAQIISPAYPYCRYFCQVFPISINPQASLDLVFTLFGSR
uniref:Transposase n=1 Tax=Mesocestoides corti TaxID=53468 RepID=A0A5K3G5G0_MESCO